MIEACNVSSDCTLEDGVIKFCYEEASFSNESFFCDCSAYFGWTGQRCDNPSTVQIFYKIFAIIIIIWSALLLILTARTVLLNFCLEYNPKNGIDPIIYTGVFVLLSTASLFISSVLLIPSFFRPDHFEIGTYQIVEKFDTVDVKYGNIVNIAAFFAITFQTFSALFMILSIDKTIASISRFDLLQENHAKSIKNKVFLVMACLILILFVILSATNNVSYGTIFIIIISFVTAVYFVYSAIKFVKAMKRISATENKIVKATTRLVRNTCVRASIALVVIFICTIAYSVSLFSLATLIGPGQFNFVILLRSIAECAGLYLLTVTAWYVNSVTEGVVLADDYPVLCCIFALWDRKNRELMPTHDDILEISKSEHFSKL